MLKLAWGLVVAGSTIVAALFGADIPKTFWDDREPWFVGAVVILGVSALRPVVQDLIGRRSIDEERQVLDALKAAHVQIVDLVGIDWKELGLHAFMVRRQLPWLWKKHLVRVARWRLKSAPPVVGIDWTRGKGLIGRCWQLRQTVGADLVHDWGLDALSREDWDQLDPELKYGLTFDEYERLRAYGAIVATPILDDNGRFRGCISADAPPGTFELLWSDPVREALHDAALWAGGVARKLSAE